MSDVQRTRERNRRRSTSGRSRGRSGAAGCARTSRSIWKHSWPNTRNTRTILRELFPALELLAHMSVVEGDASVSAAGHVPRAADTSVPVEGVLGDFRIVREIGRGGMGVVYEAEQISLKRRVALKVLPFAAVLDQKQLQRFKNEAQAAASLKHPNIVGVHSVGCERGVHYYAMEYIEGQTLAQVIDELRQRFRPGCRRRTTAEP